MSPSSYSLEREGNEMPMRKTHLVREFMTPAPHTIDADSPLISVLGAMREYGVRHLPVKRGKDVIGVISDRSVKSAMATRLGEKLKAADVLTPEPFTVPAHADLAEVVSVMADEKYGCALVKDDGGKLVGIFTTVDACRALRRLLEENAFS